MAATGSPPPSPRRHQPCRAIVDRGLSELIPSDVDLAALTSAGDAIASRAAAVAKDAAYITVGLGILGFQRTQLARREITRAMQRAAEGLTASR